MANANQIIPRSQQHGTIDSKPRDRQQCGQLTSRNCENSCHTQSHKNDNEQWTIYTNDDTIVNIPKFALYGNLAWVCESMSVRRY